MANTLAREVRTKAASLSESKVCDTHRARWLQDC